jgi:TonB family protein
MTAASLFLLTVERFLIHTMPIGPLVALGRSYAIVLVALAACASNGTPPVATIRDFGCPEFTPAAADTAIDYEARPLAGPPSANRSAPRYPVALRGNGVSGYVIVSFAIDTAGNVIRNSGRIVSASHADFAKAVCDWLPRAQYVPIRRAGRPIVANLRNLLMSFEITR